MISAMITIISIIIALSVLYFGLSSIVLKLRFGESIKYIDLSYTLFRLHLLPGDMTGQVYIAGIGLKKFNLLELILPGKHKKKIKEDIPIKKKRKFAGVKSLGFGQILCYLEKLYHPIRKIKIKYLNIDISDGFSDPYHTGQLYAIYTTASGIFPKLMSHVNFRPDFSADRIKINGEGLVKLRIYHILLPVLQILTDKILSTVKNPFLRLRKGTSYV